MKKVLLYEKNSLTFDELDYLDSYYLENEKKKNQKLNLENEKQKLKKKKEKFYHENEKQILEYEKLKKLDDDILEWILNKKSVKKLKEKRKKLVDKNLNNKFYNIENLEKFINFLDKKPARIINDKKWIDKLWKNIDLMDKVTREIVFNYFIVSFLDKDYFLNLDILNKKLKNQYSKKDLKSMNELQAFNLKSLKSDFIENFDSKYIIDYMKEFYSTAWINNIKDIEKLLKEKQENILQYRFNLRLIKENKKDLKNLKEFKKKYYKEYQKNENRININLKRKSEKIIEKFWFLYESAIDEKIKKKVRYKRKIDMIKNWLLEFLNNEYKKNKWIGFNNFLDKNLDLDLDKNQEFKKLKVIVRHELD